MTKVDAELLETLTKIRDWLQVYESWDKPPNRTTIRRCLRKARAAIAKAKGELDDD